ncbi:Immunoglobulin domain-containing protein oig-1 [Sarcoptes scabiei]|uniref:Immunoglobulin domain-containing protein oig-1 n=1 Tax=Sarcoptes scabiei TaxID=52283 RepID=A0A834VDB7_SARSC|nr:Immunoglobulin domain-containing protein oig-1 [Sarcoptes scabiei]
MAFKITIFLCWVLLFLLFFEYTNCLRGKGSRRRKISKQNSKLIFHTNSKRADYYSNENGAQIIRSSHFDYEFYLGHKIVFICVAIGDPLPTITWFKDGIEIDTTMNNYLHINEWKYKKGNEAKIKSKLEIDPARQMDSGSYECMVRV